VRTLARCREVKRAAEARAFYSLSGMWRWALGGGLSVCLALFLMCREPRFLIPSRSAINKACRKPLPSWPPSRHRIQIRIPLLPPLLHGKILPLFKFARRFARAEYRVGPGSDGHLRNGASGGVARSFAASRYQFGLQDGFGSCQRSQAQGRTHARHSDSGDQCGGKTRAARADSFDRYGKIWAPSNDVAHPLQLNARFPGVNEIKIPSQEELTDRTSSNS